MQLNNLIKNNKKKIRVGRGIGSGKGKTSSRGHKGQKSRSGVSIKNKTATLNLSKIQSMFDKSKNELQNSIDLKILKEKKLINKKYLRLKILGTGEIKKNIEIIANYASKNALEKVKKVGGKITITKK